MSSELLFKKKKGDYSLLILVTLLSLIGTVFIYSASNYSAKATYDDSFFFVKKQILGIVIGFFTMLGACFFDYNKLKKFCIPISIVSFVTLALVFIPGIGVENYGARRWLNLGAVTLQPSEISKFALILFCATYFSKNPEKTKTFLGILPVLAFGLATCALIILEPNMSITVCVVLLMLTMLFCAGMKIKLFLVLVLPAIILGVILIIAEPYRLKRLSAFLNPWSSPKGEGYQLLQSLYALGSGGWFGVGLFNSRQKYAFLPFAESDFIFAIIGEELGFVVSAIILIIYLIIIINFRNCITNFKEGGVLS